MENRDVLISKIIATKDLDNDALMSIPGKVYSFLNPVSYLDALGNKVLFEGLDGIFADGTYLGVAIHCLYGQSVKRRSFDMTSLAPVLFEYACVHNKSIYIVASKSDEVSTAVNIFKNRYPNINIIGYRDGYFDNDAEKDKEAESIVKLNPDFLIVGMGIMAQEDFILRVKKKGFRGIGFTCGGFIHQTALNKINYYPKWVDSFNLRFIYRFLKERHTRIRYLKTLFVFPYHFVKEKFASSKKMMGDVTVSEKYSSS